MTTLHWILIGLGVLFVGGVVLFNQYQERRLRRRIEGMFDRGEADYSSIDSGELTSTGGLRASKESPFHRPDAEPDTYEDMAHLLRQNGPDNDVELPPLPLPPREPDGDRNTLPDFKAPAPEVGMTEGVSGQSTTSSAPTTAKIDRPGPVAEPPEPVKPPRPTVSQPSAAPKASASPLDADVEYVARFKHAQPVAVDYGKLTDALARIGKPVRAFLQTAGGQWMALDSSPSQSGQVAEFGLQLADRDGPAGQLHLEAFCNALYEFAAEQGGAVSCPDVSQALERARTLDGFCAEVDVLIGLNVVAGPGASYAMDDLGRLLSEAGLGLQAGGVYVRRGQDGATLYTVANQNGEAFVPGQSSATHAVTLLFDVPKVADGLGVFDEMTRLGFHLAGQLGGRLMDDNGHAVTQDSLQKDRRQLASFYGRMESFGIPAGSERALRLFA